MKKSSVRRTGKGQLKSAGLRGQGIRRRVRASAAHGEERLRAILYSAGDAVIATDATGRVTSMNPVAEQLTGWTEAEASGRPLMEVFRIINEESRARVEDPVARILREGIVIGLANHTLLIARDGREIPIADAGAPIFEAQRRITGVVLVFRDQTRERAAQRAVQEAREFAENIIATVHDALLVLDADLRVVSANPAFCRLFEVRPQETAGRYVYELGNRQWDIPELRQLLETILPQNTHFDDFEMTHPFERLGVRTMRLNARRIRSERGDKTRLILLAIEDITERKRAEEEREQLRAQLAHAQRLEAIGTLASGVAHEINNPLMGIMNYAELIRGQVAPESAAATYVTEITRESERVAELTKNLLLFARQDGATRRPESLCQIVRRVIALLRPVLRRSQIRLEVQVPEDLPLVVCAPQRVQQVVMNLLTNAQDALNEKHAGAHEDKVISINAQVRTADAGGGTGSGEQGAAWVRLTVEDRGMGIPAEIRERIFDPFFTTKPPEKGTGLGLAISYGIVKEHGGTLSVESEPGRWTRFHVDLPVAGEASAGPASVG